MDGYTDEPFRLVQAEISKPDVTFTEFVSAEGLSRGGVGLYDALFYSSIERPIIGQIFGKDPDSFYKSAIILCHLGFDGVDINMGCPAKTVTQNGSGAALIGKPELASEIIKAVRSGIDDWFNKKVTINDLKLNQKTHAVIARNLKYSNYQSPATSRQLPTLSVKTRVGITEPVIDTWIPHLLSHKLDFLTLHGRTLKQGYSGLADWSLISKSASLAHQTSTKLWGNGDVSSRSQAITKGKECGVDGILIGRSALGNPWVFSDKEGSFQDKFHAMARHAYHFNQVFPNRLFDSLRKHFLLYASGHPHAKQLRSKLVSLSSLDQLYAIEQDFLAC